MLRQVDEHAKKNVSHVRMLQATIFSSKTISKALVRDDFRCMVTRGYDYAAVKNDEIMQDVRDRLPMCSTQRAHIFPQSTNVGISGSNHGGPKVRICFLLLHLDHC